MSTDAEIAAVLRVIQQADDAGEPADNESLAAALGWELDDIALCLECAREKLLVWGWREGRKPGPWFSALEVTVQGERYLRTAP